jgi:hypothetical protein
MSCLYEYLGGYIYIYYNHWLCLIFTLQHVNHSLIKMIQFLPNNLEFVHLLQQTLKAYINEQDG